MLKDADMERDINSPTPANDRHDLYVDERTKERVRKHLSDPNDKITEEDIANVNTEMYEHPASEEENEEIEKRVDDDTAKKAPSAWDLKTDE